MIVDAREPIEFDDGELFCLPLHGPALTPWEWEQRNEKCPHPWRPQQAASGLHYFVQGVEPFTYVCDGCGVKQLTSKDGPR